MEVLYFVAGVILTIVLSQPFLEILQRARRRITWRAFGRAMEHTLQEVKRGNWMPDVIVGLNSGIVPASVLALNLRVEDIVFYDCLPEYRDGKRLPVAPGVKAYDFRDKNILVVDDQAYTGRSLERIYDHLIAEAGADPARIRRHALFAYEGGAGPIELDLAPYQRVAGGVKEMPWVISPAIAHFWSDRNVKS